MFIANINISCLKGNYLDYINLILVLTDLSLVLIKKNYLHIYSINAYFLGKP